MNKFRKKPVVVEAMQFDGSPTRSRAILEWMVGGDWHRMSLESMRVEPGDWVIKGIKGEFYPCKPDISLPLTSQLLKTTATRCRWIPARS